MIIGIAIPIKDEVRYLYELKRKIDKLKIKFKLNIVFIDGSKNSKCRNLIRSIFGKSTKILLDKNKRNFFNLSNRCLASNEGFKYLIKYTDSKFIVDMDSDLATNPEDILLAEYYMKRKNFDLIIFSKYLQKSITKKRQTIRRFISFYYSIYCKKMFSNKITDYSNSYRIYTRQSMKKLLNEKITFSSPTQHLENLIFYIKNKYKIVQLPACYTDTGKGSNTIKLHHFFIFFLQIIFLTIKYKIK